LRQPSTECPAAPEMRRKIPGEELRCVWEGVSLLLSRDWLFQELAAPGKSIGVGPTGKRIPPVGSRLRRTVASNEYQPKNEH
jgi:hypothetical protein